MKFSSTSIIWLFNGYMLWGAGLGLLFGVSWAKLQETLAHQGPGFVHHGDGERGPEWSEEVSESQYKRHNYAMVEFMIVIALVLWFAVARAAKNETLKAQAKMAYLEAAIKASAAYQHAFASAIDEAERAHAEAKALSSPSFLEAKAIRNSAESIYVTHRDS